MATKKRSKRASFKALLPVMKKVTATTVSSSLIAVAPIWSSRPPVVTETFLETPLEAAEAKIKSEIWGDPELPKEKENSSELRLVSIPIRAKVRKVKTRWTVEKDLNCFGSIDAVAELTAMLQEEIKKANESSQS